MRSQNERHSFPSKVSSERVCNWTRVKYSSLRWLKAGKANAANRATVIPKLTGALRVGRTGKLRGGAGTLLVGSGRPRDR